MKTCSSAFGRMVILWVVFLASFLPGRSEAALSCSIRENVTPEDYGLSDAAKKGIKHTGSNSMNKFQAFHCYCTTDDVST